MQPLRLYSLASFLLAFLLGDILAAPLASFGQGAIQVLGRDFPTLEIRHTTLDLETRGNTIATVVDKVTDVVKPDQKPKHNTCPYCGTSYKTFQEVKECSDPPKSGKISCKSKF
ncbi:hypothetical protein C8J56DRAFT_898962 [Mycena floridula]|nr:hypothetical protein C8J56DRAFT_901950 [Mycena floridula]KAJ7577325.1 hypothetical protein C8J56DRAFT_898962 [Mycena floridula]